MEDNKNENTENERYQVTSVSKKGSKIKKIGLTAVALLMIADIIKVIIRDNVNISTEEISPAVIVAIVSGIVGGLYAMGFFSDDEKDDSKENKK